MNFSQRYIVIFLFTLLINSIERLSDNAAPTWACVLFPIIFALVTGKPKDGDA
jgi:hypothetical protein